MAKNKISAFDIEKIQNLSYQELGKAVVSGNYSLKQLRQAYSQMRSTAQKRIERLNKPKNIRQFGQPEKEFFRTTKALTTSSELLKELKDVSKFLTTKGTTISGLKERRDYTIERMKESGFNVDKKDYPELIRFMEWFKTTEFAKQYDSDSPVVAQVFNTEKPNEDDWERAFNAFKGIISEPTPSRKY